MSFGMFQAKRVVRWPLIWYGRRRAVDQPPAVRRRMEQHAYRRRVQRAWAAHGVDPLHIYRADLDASSTVVDVGAFRGEVAEDIRGLYDCQVYAFEPHPDFYRVLEDRFADTSEVTTFEYGLGAGEGTFELTADGQASSIYSPPERTATTVEVRIRDIADALDDLGHERIDYLKLNIEGAEYDALDRLYAAGWNERIRYLLIQFHEWYPGADRRRWRIRRRLRATHSEVFNYPWSYELWCAKDQPHPPPPVFTREQMATIQRELAEQRDARASANAEAGPGAARPPEQPG